MALTKAQRLLLVIGISFSFFVAEISVGFYTKSLALVADAFHYMNDLVGFIVALVALRISQREKTPEELSFGWQRAQLLGAFFNGVFLLALGVSIFLQSIERFISLQEVKNPMLVLIMGCVGLTLNIISVLFLHEHDHDHGPAPETPAADSNSVELEDAEHSHKDHRHILPKKTQGHSHDLGMMGVLVHLVGDAINNIGVIIAASVIWKATYPGRYYADPGVSMGISFMIFLSSIPLCKNAGSILLESVPLGVSLEDIKHDLEKVPGVLSIHELHAWRLSQHKALASAHVLTTDDSLSNFMESAKMINECLHAYGIHSTTLQPEIVSKGEVEASLKVCSTAEDAGTPTGISNAIGGSPKRSLSLEAMRKRWVGGKGKKNCQINCGTLCEELTCCG